MKRDLPPNTVERLSNYRRQLKLVLSKDKEYIHSHQLAHLLRINPAHIRRDLMLIGFAGDVHKGYNIKSLIAEIGKNIDCIRRQRVAFIGIGDLGRSLAQQFSGKDSKLEIVAAFRLGGNAKNELFGVKCYDLSKLKSILKQESIDIVVLALPNIDITDTVNSIVAAGVNGILNFTSAHLDVPDEVFVENYDMVGKLEKLSYFTSCG